MKENYGSAYRDAIHEVHMEIDSEKTVKGTEKNPENTGKSGSSGTPPPVTSESTNTSPPGLQTGLQTPQEPIGNVIAALRSELHAYRLEIAVKIAVPIAVLVPVQ
jgi:hypothetical protein